MAEMQESLWARRRLLTLPWTLLEDSLQRLEAEIRRSGFEPTSILGIARGGLVPAIVLANRLKIKDFGVISVTRNLSDDRFSDRGDARFGWMAPADWELSCRRILVVDDIAGDGATLARTCRELRARGAKELRTVVVVKNVHCQTAPDHYAAVSDDWVVFPWESEEAPSGLASEVIKL